MWHSAVITIEGDVVPCCFDKNAKHTYVNVEKIDIKEIRNLKEYKQYSTVILKNRKNIDICNNCSE
jgi:radical SAM protein with 4Fe4S-binding SPASM domain